eukprot:TRINITY_DN40956_c0_g1_i1.p1 TRINITY_DN40956_c0_g1~~TRINITY_DN40956_c0_g1_i1.p1  ORF type:complete len:294 (-),score=39.72 TRINITY_DN40956_c0_g1_i1:77-958(-)
MLPITSTDLSLVVSVWVAFGWVVGASRVGGGEDAPVSRSMREKLMQTPWSVIMLLKDLNQALPTLFMLLAATSITKLLQVACSLGLQGVDAEGGWLGTEELSTGRWTALQIALVIWRAEKLESLLLRMERSANVVKQDGLGNAIVSSFKDPYGYLWPPIWGIGRRAAQIYVSSAATLPFLHLAFPIVAADESLWWLLDRLRGFVDRKIYRLPMVVDIVILPVVDLLHFVPVIVTVFILAIQHLPEYQSSGTTYPLVLSSCALAWTVHNCHLFYTSALVDVPQSARDLWSGAMR